MQIDFDELDELDTLEELCCNTARSDQLKHDVDNILDRDLPLKGTSEACISTCDLPKPGGGQRHSWMLHGLLKEREAQVPGTLTRAHFRIPTEPFSLGVAVV